MLMIVGLCIYLDYSIYLRTFKSSIISIFCVCISVVTSYVKRRKKKTSIWMEWRLNVYLKTTHERQEKRSHMQVYFKYRIYIYLFLPPPLSLSLSLSESTQSLSRYSTPKIITTNTCYLMVANDQALWKLQKTKNRIEIGQCVLILYHFFDIAKLPKNLPEMVKLSKMA